MNKTTILSVLAVAILIGIGIWVWKSSDKLANGPAVNDFDSCVLAGYPVMESYPRKCTTPDGQTFTEDTTAAREKGGCYIGGCSQQLCSDQPDAVSTCEYREEYSCYQTATCERQSSGQCGWTQSTALNTCLNVILYPNAELK